MEYVLVQKLKKGKSNEDLYHKSGKKLILKGDEITEEKIEALKKAGITYLIKLSPGENEAEVMYNCKYHRKPLEELKEGEKITNPVYSPEGLLLIEAGKIVSSSLINSLKKRKISQIYIKKSREELGIAQVKTYEQILEEIIKKKEEQENRPPRIIIELPQKKLIQPGEITPVNIETRLSRAELIVVPEGTPAYEELNAVEKLKFREQLEKQRFLNLHKEAIENLKEVFSAFQNNEIVDGGVVGKTLQYIIGSFLKDKDLLANLVNMMIIDEYLLAHCFNVTILAIQIGCLLGYSKEQLYELAYGAFLHDVGMLKIPNTILEKKGQLDTRERLIIQRHPIYSIEILQKIKNIPFTTPFVAYQVHERLNGTGYPRRKKDKIIHDFAKIVAVADVYDALTKDRPYRIHYLPYKAMELIIRMTSRGLFEPKVVKALLKSISLFPVGSWIQLNNGDIAKVISSNIEDYTRPVISVAIEKGKYLENPILIDLREHKDLKVVKSIEAPSKGSDVMFGF